MTNRSLESDIFDTFQNYNTKLLKISNAQIYQARNSENSEKVNTSNDEGGDISLEKKNIRKQCIHIEQKIVV